MTWLRAVHCQAYHQPAGQNTCKRAVFDQHCSDVYVCTPPQMHAPALTCTACKTTCMPRCRAALAGHCWTALGALIHRHASRASVEVRCRDGCMPCTEQFFHPVHFQSDTHLDAAWQHTCLLQLCTALHVASLLVFSTYTKSSAFTGSKVTAWQQGELAHLSMAGQVVRATALLAAPWQQGVSPKVCCAVHQCC